MTAAGPALMGYPDSGWYIRAAAGHLFVDPWRPAGYALFLRLPHALDANLSFTILVQHGLGVASALLLFLSVRRVAPAAWGLLPAAVVLLAGPQVLLEQTPLSETLFVFLVTLLVYFTARALDRGPQPWAYLAGLSTGAIACVRVIGLVLPVVVAIGLVLGSRGPIGRRVGTGAAVIVSALLVLVPYVWSMTHETRYQGNSLTRTGGWAVYSRVAPFADCHRFAPPAGTRKLCEDRPPSTRPDPPFYGFTAGSPAIIAFGDPRASTPKVNSALSAFARAAIIHQPLDYARAVASDLPRFWSSDHGYDTYAGQSYDSLRQSLLGSDLGVTGAARHWYSTARAAARGTALDTLLTYERHTRLEGPLLILFVLLTLVGVPLARGRRRTLGVLAAAVALVALLAPVMSAFFDARYVVPAYGPLAAAAAIGAASLTERIATMRRGAVASPHGDVTAAAAA